MADKVKYLDLAGLTTYDGKIKGVIDSKVAAGIAAIPTSEITSVTQKTGENSDQFEIAYKNNKGESKTTDFTIGAPTLSTVENATAYGLMSSDDKDAIDKNKTDISALSTKVDNLVTAGGEPNKIDTISLNNKAVSFTVDAAKNADLTLDVDYDTETKKVRLKSGEKILSSFDASAFIKDGMLNSAEIITVPSEGNEATVDRPAGKYIKLTWNTDAGKDATYIPVKDIIKEYTFAGSADGITLHTNATRGNVKVTDTLTSTTETNGAISVKSGGSLADGSWFTKVDEELDAVPTTYAKATDVNTLSGKVDDLVASGGEPNKINTISLNGKKASFAIDDSKNADLTLDVNYDATSKKVQLKSGTTVLSDFDASALVKDSDLDSVTLVNVTTADATDERPAGKYFKFTWNKDAGKEDVYISAENAYPYMDTVALAGAGYNSETRGSWRIFQTISPTILPTGDIKREFNLEFTPGDDVDGKTGNWFKAVEDELDAIPTTYAKATDVTTSLAAKADKTELPTVSATSSISIQDTLNYGDKSFTIDLDATKTGVNNEVKLSDAGFTTWVSAVDIQVKTNTDAIAALPGTYAAKSHTHVRADITDFDTITTDDIDALFA